MQFPSHAIFIGGPKHGENMRMPPEQTKFEPGYRFDKFLSQILDRRIFTHHDLWEDDNEQA